MAKKSVVKIFYPKKDTMLTTNASEHSIFVILSQEHLIMYLSRRLTNTERILRAKRGRNLYDSFR